jgi:hypothetical protein
LADMRTRSAWLNCSRSLVPISRNVGITFQHVFSPHAVAQPWHLHLTSMCFETAWNPVYSMILCPFCKQVMHDLQYMNFYSMTLLCRI